MLHKTKCNNFHLQKVLIALICGVSILLVSAMAATYYYGDFYNDWIYPQFSMDPCTVQDMADSQYEQGYPTSATKPQIVIDTFLQQQEFYGQYSTIEYSIEHSRGKIFKVKSENGGLYIELQQPCTKGEQGIWVVRRFRLMNEVASTQEKIIKTFNTPFTDSTFSLCFPDSWEINMGGAPYFAVDDLSLGSIEYRNISEDTKIKNETEPIFLWNHSEWISTTHLDDLPFTCYQVDYIRTPPVASPEQSSMYITAFVFPINEHEEIILKFNNFLVQPEIRMDIVKSFKFE